MVGATSKQESINRTSKYRPFVSVGSRCVLDLRKHRVTDSNQPIAGACLDEVGTMKLSSVHWSRLTGLEQAHSKPQPPKLARC